MVNKIIVISKLLKHEIIKVNSQKDRLITNKEGIYLIL